MRTLVTGVTGFVGGHLIEALAARGGCDLHGLSRKAAWPAEWCHLAGTVRLHAADLTDGPRVETILRTVQPQWIFHLAGYAHAGRSFHEPQLAWAHNLTATLNLYDAVARWGGRPRILSVSTGLVYGSADPAGPGCDEQSVLLPVSPYAASKGAADLAGYQYTRHPGLDIVRVRPFNHTGPRQSPQYALGSFARQVVAIEQGRQGPVLEVGDLSSRRDLSDVRDVVRAYLLLLERGRSGEVYNVGSGEAHSMRAVLDRLLALASVAVEVRTRPSEVRPVDDPIVRADTRKLRRETGWLPRYPLDQTLADILDYWRHARAPEASVLRN